MARLALSLLGSFTATLDGALITTFESAKVRALLAYLAAEADRPHRREALSALLWPDWPQQSAMSNLRYALADLRKNIGDREAQPSFLIITRESIQLNRQADVWVDVGEFEAGIGDQRSATRDLQSSISNLQSTIEHLQSAISLYRGTFLEGFSVPDSPAFEQWVLARRESLQRQALLALFTLAEAHEQRGDLEAALPYARRQLELEPWHEPGQQQLMRLLALSGQRAAALGQYEACRKALADELNVEPSAETKRLYEAIRDEDIQEIRGQAIGEKPLTSSPYPLPPEPGEAPFKGLQYFDVADAELFFGREALTARLVGHIRQMVDVSVGATHPLPDETQSGGKMIPNQVRVGDDGSLLQNGCCFLAVVGASGSGKSSVVRAGVVPALQNCEALADGTLPPDGSPGWHIHVFTPTTHPLEALAVSLMRATRSVSDTAKLIDDLGREPRSLHLYAQHLLASQSPGPAGKCRLLLVVDQFEELFTLCRSEAERSAFLDNLLNAVEGGGPTQVVVVLRADFYGSCAQYPRLRQALTSRQEYIGPMSAPELRQAIEQPALRNGWDFEPGLIELILRDVGASEDHPPEPGALPLLEHALLETWKRRSGRTLTHQGYVEAGGVHGAIAKTAESVFTRLTPEQQTLARRIFMRLTELGEGTQDTRRRAPLVELSPQPEDAPQVANLLKTLADARLITLSEDTAEVAHEALIREWPALRQWLSEDREGLRIHRRLTEAAGAWEELDCDAGELYRGARLAQGAEWAENHAEDLNALEREFLQASQAQAERDVVEREAQRQRELQAAQRLARTQRQRSLVLSIGLSIAVILIGVALWLNSRANTSLGQAVDARKTAQVEANNRSTQQALAEFAQGTAQSEAYNRATLEAIANQEAQIAFSRQLAAQSLSLQKEEYPLALLQAIEASFTADTAQAEGSLLSTLNDNPRLQFSLQSQTSEVESLAFSPDGKTLAVGNGDTTITLWDFSNPDSPILPGQPLFGHTRGVTSVIFSPDGKMLASGNFSFAGEIGTIRLWDLSNPAAPIAFGRPLPGSTIAPDINSLVFSADGKMLIAVSNDGLITLWDISTPAAPIPLRQTIYLPVANVYSIAISPDGKTLASGCTDGTILLWDFTDPAAPMPLGLPLRLHTKEVASIVFSPDGKTLASGSFDHTVILWDVSNLARPVPYGPPLAGHTDNVTSLAFSPDGKTLASGSNDKTVILWDVTNPERAVPIDTPLVGHTGFVNSVAFSPDGKWVASGGCSQISYVDYICHQGQIILWGASPSKVLSHLGQRLAGHADQVTGVAFNPNGKMLASGSADRTIRLWDVSGSAAVPLGQPLGGQVEISSIAFSPDGQRLASGNADATIRLWNVANPAAPIQLGPPLSGHTDKVTSLVFSPDGKTLASGSNDSTIILWNVSNPAAPVPLAPPLTGHNWLVTSLAFSPDGKTLASGSQDNTVILWDVSKPGAPVLLGKPLTGYGRAVFSLAFSPDGKILASGGGDRFANLGSILMWEISTPAAPVLLGQPLTRLSTPVYSLAFRPDGKQLAAANGDATITLWDVSDPAAPISLDQPLIGHTGEVLSLAYSPDGKRLASAGSDANIFLWDVSLKAWQSLACRIAGRNMTKVEWRQYLTGLPYQKTCTQWEEGK